MSRVLLAIFCFFTEKIYPDEEFEKSRQVHLFCRKRLRSLLLNIIGAIINSDAIYESDFREPSYIVLGFNSRKNTGGYLHKVIVRYPFYVQIVRNAGGKPLVQLSVFRHSGQNLRNKRIDNRRVVVPERLIASVSLVRKFRKRENVVIYTKIMNSFRDVHILPP